MTTFNQYTNPAHQRAERRPYHSIALYYEMLSIAALTPALLDDEFEELGVPAIPVLRRTYSDYD